MRFSFNFTGNRFRAMALSGLIILASVVWIGWHGMDYGIDFTGGTKIILRFARLVGTRDIETVRGCLGRLGLDGSVQSFEKNGIIIEMKGTRYTDQVKALLRAGRDAAGGRYGSEDQVRAALQPLADLKVPELVLRELSVGADSPPTGRLDVNAISDDNLTAVLERALNEQLANDLRDAIGKELGLTGISAAGKVDLNTLGDSFAVATLFRDELAPRLTDALLAARSETFTSFEAVGAVSGPFGVPAEAWSKYVQLKTPGLDDEVQLNLNVLTRAQLLALVRDRVLVEGEPGAALTAAAVKVAARIEAEHGLLAGLDPVLALPIPDHLKALLQERTIAAPFLVASVEMVGPRIGAELRQRAIYAALISIAALLIYITVRFQVKYAVGAILALAHDAVVTVGVMALLGQEFDLNVLAAVLTILGYSINDTIVIYDRIREKLRLTGATATGGDWEQLINLAINETLSRTIITSLTVFMTVLALVLLGGPVIFGFSLAMLIGVVSGTWSTVFIAAPILIEWHNYFERKR